jgi:protein-disulfide isomerase
MDLECPFCRRAIPTLAALQAAYGDDLRVVFRHNPLPFHRHAAPAAIAVMEAFAQGGADLFWRLHDVLLNNQEGLDRQAILAAGAQVGLDAQELGRALDERRHWAAIEQDMQLAAQVGAHGTPAFFINGRQVMGAQPIPVFTAVIDDELERVRTLVAQGTPRNRVYQALMAHALERAPEPEPEPTHHAAPRVETYDLAVPAKAPRLGPPNAKVTLQLFTDFECPFCARVVPTIAQIRERYGKDVAVVFRNYPLPFHQHARLAHRAAWEVYVQRGEGAFWRYHDVLFDNQRALARDDLERYARELGGIHMGRFGRALDGDAHDDVIRRDMAAVDATGARIGTPSAFINGRLVQGARPFEAFARVIDEALAK